MQEGPARGEHTLLEYLLPPRHKGSCCLFSSFVFFLKIFFKWTIFKVFIEFGIVCFCLRF